MTWYPDKDDYEVAMASHCGDAAAQAADQVNNYFVVELKKLKELLSGGNNEEALKFLNNLIEKGCYQNNIN